MGQSVTIGSGAVVGISAAVLIAGLAVGGGALLGGYALGAARPAEVPTELAEKTYTDADLEAAIAACALDGAVVEDHSVTLPGDEWPALNRQCFVTEMDATGLADRDYTGGLGVDGTLGATYHWSNVTMTWKQTDQGRDLTISVS
ncbi:hypothetical protein C1N80_06260 [Brachybacterium sp. SGAir0954]|uniref:hypothetical protein n=1 Tax=Brachybacterium sp. SGAir0954 TaxID=2571029 RepID=UPI0010CCDC5D|nr:hypothetical protein [Brachybacterium sp. SGAir0954]QCR53223.1 hypothetical protein C1N80_06260 [Brachybacterium sp. SGAir0954]